VVGKRHSSISSWDRALYILSRRDHSVKELRDKLSLKQHTEKEIDETLQKLLDKGYLDEDRYFKSRCRSLLNRRYGKIRIQQDVQRRGLKWNPEFFEELIQEYSQNSSETLFEDLLDKKAKAPAFQKKLKLARSDSTQRYKLYQACMAFLAGRGYSVHEFSDRLKKWLNTQCS
jgi:SOS response regulatory protein OraA/RecX